jgi:hypothetical protein
MPVVMHSLLSKQLRVDSDSDSDLTAAVPKKNKRVPVLHTWHHKYATGHRRTIAGVIVSLTD